MTVTRRFYAVALVDVLPLEPPGWRMPFHNDRCPSWPDCGAADCRGDWIEFFQRPRPDSGLRDAAVELTSVVGQYMDQAPSDDPAPPPLEGLASFAILSTSPLGPVYESEDEEFDRLFELMQRCVDGFRQVAGFSRPIPRLTRERLWPLLVAFEDHTDGDRVAIGVELSLRGRIFSAPSTFLTDEQLQQAMGHVVAASAHDPANAYRHIHLGARQAHVDGDYEGAVLKAAAAAESLIKTVAGMLTWEATTFRGRAAPWAMPPDALFNSKPGQLLGKVLGPALKGDWSIRDPHRPMGVWHAHIARPRNRVIHEGHIATMAEADAAVAALPILERHVVDRLAAEAQRHPRTALLLAGRESLERRSAWGKVRATAEGGDVRAWRRAYVQWAERSEPDE